LVETGFGRIRLSELLTFFSHSFKQHQTNKAKSIATMHSNYSSNSRCMEQTLSNAQTMHSPNNTNILPSIEENVVMEGTHQFLEDMEVILAGAAPATVTVLEEDLSKPPRPVRDLRALLPENERHGEKKPVSTSAERLSGLRRRLETYLEDEMARAYEKDIKSEEEAKEAPEEEKVSKVENKKIMKKMKKEAKTAKIPDSPIVWIIEPGYFKGDHTLRFKLRTDGGACLILKDAEALETIEIMKKASENVYFQVYTLEGGVSRIVKPDKINQIIEETLADAMPGVEEEDIFTTGDQETETKVKHHPGGRFIRYIMRRRWKNLVRRQVSIAAGNRGLHSRARGLWVALFPLLMIWKMMRRTRTF
jgi:hypothetical protein